MPSNEQIKREGANDVGEWGEKDMTGAYAKGTMCELPDGSKVDLSKVPDIIGGKAKPKRPK